MHRECLDGGAELADASNRGHELDDQSHDDIGYQADLRLLASHATACGYNRGMSIVEIAVIVVLAVAVLAFFLLPGRGPLNSFARAADQHNRVSGFGKPLDFRGDLRRPRDEGGS